MSDQPQKQDLVGEIKNDAELPIEAQLVKNIVDTKLGIMTDTSIQDVSQVEKVQPVTDNKVEEEFKANGQPNATLPNEPTIFVKLDGTTINTNLKPNPISELVIPSQPTVSVSKDPVIANQPSTSSSDNLVSDLKQYVPGSIGPNEPTMYVYLKDQGDGILHLPGNLIYNQPPMLESDSASIKVKDKFVGWREVNSKPSHLEANLEHGTRQVNHLRNKIVVFASVMMTYVGVMLGGGLSWCLVVILLGATYYQNKVDRYRKAARDEALRELWIQKLENEAESVGWLNNFLDRFWVIYEPGLSATIKGIVDAVLEVSTPSFLESLSLTTFQLGNKAPRINSVRTYPNTDPDSVLMDWDIEFQPHHDLNMTLHQQKNQINPKVVLQIRVGKGMVGAGMPVLVEDFSLRGTMRVRITFGDRFPHLEIVGFQFLSSPDIDYVLKPVGGETFGFDIGNIPGLSSFIRDQIHGILSPMMYSPNEFMLNIGDMMNPGSDNDVVGIINITVKFAKGLKFKDGSGDPYVLIHASKTDQFIKTTYKQNTANPTYNETYQLVLYGQDTELLVKVIDYNSFRKDAPCGEGTLDLSTFIEKPLQSNSMIIIKRDNAYVGNVSLDCNYIPVLSSPIIDPTSPEDSLSGPGVLQFTLHQIKQLDASKSLIGKFTPYVIINIDDKDRLQTSKKKRSNDPVYENRIDLPIKGLRNCMVNLIIKDDRGMAVDPTIAKFSQPAWKIVQQSGWFPLNNAKSGKVKLSAKFHPFPETALIKSVDSSIGLLQLNVYEALKLRLEYSKADVAVRILLNSKAIGRTNLAGPEGVPRFMHEFEVPIVSFNDVIRLEVVEFQTGRNEGTVVGYVDQPIAQLVQRSGDEIESKGLLNFWQPLVNRSNRPCGLIHFGSHLFLAKPKVDVLEKQEPAFDEIKLESDIKGDVIPEEVEVHKDSHKSGLLTLTLHGAKNLHIGSISAAAFLGSTETKFLFETSVKTDTAHPVWDHVHTIFVKQVLNNQVTVVIQQKKTEILARFTCSVEDLIGMVGGKRTIELGEGIQLQLSVGWVEIAYSNVEDKQSIVGYGKLKVRLIGANNLAGVDSSGTSDPFVKVRLNSTRVFKSQVHKKTLNPIFDESFVVPVLDIASSQLKLELFDWNKINTSVKLGHLTLKLDRPDLMMGRRVELNEKLDDGRGGLQLVLKYEMAGLSDEELNLAAGYSTMAQGLKMDGSSLLDTDSSILDVGNNSVNTNQVMNVVSASLLAEDTIQTQEGTSGRSGKIKVHILSAEKLVAVDRGGTSDPYIKVKLDGKQLYQSKTIKKNCNPEWDESFMMNVDGLPCYLHFSVMDHNRLHSDENIGNIDINLWDHVQPDQEGQPFYTSPLKGGEPGRLYLCFQYVQV